MVQAFHYCPLDSLYGIIESGVLRASRVTYLDDPEDCLWLQKHARNGLEEILAVGARSENAHVKQETEILYSKFDSELRMAEEFGHNHYVACFSRNSDTLSQWRHYAKNCTGVAICFDLERLGFSEIPTTNVPYSVCGWANVRYGDESVAKVIEAMVEVLVSAEGITDSAEIGDYWMGMMWPREEVLSDIISCGFTLTKDPAYREEDECRIVVPDVEQIGPWPFGFALSGGVIKPHRALPILMDGQSALVEVVVGPRCRTSVRDVQVFLECAGHNEVGVRCADIGVI